MSETVLEGMSGEEAIKHLQTFFLELDEARDPNGKTGPDDDNFWVAGALQGPVVENAKRAAEVLGRLVKADFARADSFLKRAETVIDLVEHRLDANDPALPFKTLRDYGLNEGSLLDKNVRVQFDQKYHGRFPKIVAGVMFARNEGDIKEFVKQLNKLAKE